MTKQTLMNLNSKTALQSNESFVELEIPEKNTHKSKDESNSSSRIVWYNLCQT